MRGSAANSFRMSNLDALTRNDEVKFVLTDRADYDFALSFTSEHRLGEQSGEHTSESGFQQVT